MPSDLEPDGQWDRVASELRAYRTAQREAWGDIDNATLGRYLAGEVDGEERRQVENALEELPELRKLTDLVRDVMADDLAEVSAPAPAVPEPATLPFRKPAPARKSTVHWSRQRGALVAAACILLVLGVVVPQAQFYSPLGSAGRNPVTETVAYRSAPPGDLSPSPGPRVAMAKRGDAEPPPAARMLEPVALAWADGMNRVGSYNEANGDFDRAEFFLKMAHSIRNSMLGPDAAPTVESRQKLADVYQVALNTSPEPSLSLSPPADPLLFNPPAGVAADDAKKGNAWNSACQLRERITRQPVGEVRKNVTPVLTQNLRDAETPAARMQYGRALAELGAGAREAVPALKAWLDKAVSPEEQRAAVDSLAEIAPGAPDAMPVLAAALDSKSAESRRAAKDALARLGAEEGKAGYKVVAGGAGTAADKHDTTLTANYDLTTMTVLDGCEVFSPRALKRLQKESKDLARDFHVVVFTEMGSDLPRSEMKDGDAKDRTPERGVNGVYVRICKQPLTVRVFVGDAMRRQGFDADQQAQLQKILESHLAREEYDEGLLEGVRFVARFEAAQRNNATPPAPNP